MYPTQLAFLEEDKKALRKNTRAFMNDFSGCKSVAQGEESGKFNMVHLATGKH